MTDNKDNNQSTNTNNIGIWDEIIKVAEADGRITTEESKLIKTIMDNVDLYRKVLNEAFDDGVIDEGEKEELIDHRAAILNEAYKEASADKKISSDELNIIERTLKLVHKLELREDEFSSYWV